MMSIRTWKAQHTGLGFGASRKREYRRLSSIARSWCSTYLTGTNPDQMPQGSSLLRRSLTSGLKLSRRKRRVKDEYIGLRTALNTHSFPISHRNKRFSNQHPHLEYKYKYKSAHPSTRYYLHNPRRKRKEVYYIIYPERKTSIMHVKVIRHHHPSYVVFIYRTAPSCRIAEKPVGCCVSKLQYLTHSWRIKLNISVQNFRGGIVDG